MTKLLYPIYKLPQRTYGRNIPTWIKYWLYTKSFIENVKELSEILTGSEFTLLNTVSRKFKIFELGGRTEQDGEATPENPVPIKNVTGNANVKIQNKNLLPNNLTWQYGYVNGSGDWVADATHKNAYSDYIYLKAGTYTISYEIATTIISIAKYNTSKVFIERDQTNYAPNTSKNKTFTLNQDSYIRISHYDDTGSQILDNINSEKNQIEIGSTATSYVEHQEQNYPFTFAEGQRAMQGTTLQDDGMHNIRVHVILNGTEEWGVQPNKEHTFRLRLPDNRISNSGICTHYQNISISQLDVYTGVYLNYSNFAIISDLRFTSVEDFKAWLVQQYNNGTPVEIEFVIRNGEKIIPYNSTQQEQYNNFKNAYTYKDITNISGSSSELEPNLTIQYWKKKGGERSMKLSKEDLKKKLDERIEDEDLKIELLEDVEDSFEEVVEDTVEKVEKAMYDELETKYDELKTKYKDRFLSSEEVKEETTEEKDEGLTEEVVYEKEDIFEDTKKEEE